MKNYRKRAFALLTALYGVLLAPGAATAASCGMTDLQLLNGAWRHVDGSSVWEERLNGPARPGVLTGIAGDSRTP